jgi:hypothetical protein
MMVAGGRQAVAVGRCPGMRAACLIMVLAGCGSGGPRTVSVTGSVTSAGGVPVAEGEIVFRAAEGAMASWAGPIAAGRYAVRATVGPKRVEIIAVRPTSGAQPQASGEGVPNEMYIPARYNLQSELTAEITAAGPNVFDFQLELSDRPGPEGPRTRP